MIRIKAHKDIDKRKWNEAVNRIEDQFNWFMHSDYLDALSNRWIAMVYGDYEAVFPLFSRFVFSKTFYQPFFTRAFSIVGSVDDEIQESMAYALSNLKAKGCISVEGNSFLKANALCQKLEVSLSSYSSNTKRNIKKAVANGVELSPISVNQFLEFYKAETKKKLKTYKPKHFKMLSEILKGELDKKRLILNSVNKNGEVLSVAAVLQNQDKALYLCAAINEEGKKMGASHFLVHMLIENNRSVWNELDFGGSNVEGVARFYKSFGATDFSYTQLHLGE